MSYLRLKDLSKRYNNGFKAVHDINIEIEEGDFLVLVGPSGCAKSTILRMIAGLEDVTDGQVIIDGDIVNDVLPKDRDIAMVFQDYALYPHLSIYDNISFGLKLKKVSKEKIDQEVQKVATNLEIEHLLDRKPKQLSGGQRQRVALARALIKNPKVFLLDEPLSNLDAKLRVHTRAKISELHRELGTTMVYVTHDQVEAMTMGNKICVLKEGKVMQMGAPLDLYERPANLFVATFMGSPAMNTIKGELLQEGADIYFKTFGAKIKLPASKHGNIKKAIGKKVFFGIRPSQIRLKRKDPNQEEVQGMALLIEKTGSQTFVHFSINNTNIVAKVKTEEVADIELGDDITFYLNMEKCCIFDGETEENLTL